MKIAFRADSGSIIGSGHIMRCLTLANALTQKGHEILFVSKDHPGNILSQVESRGFAYATIPLAQGVSNQDIPHADWLAGPMPEDAHATEQAILEHFSADADWLVIDHYGIDYQWHQHFRSKGYNIFVIDDLADRSLDCDILLDQTFNRQEKAYDSKLITAPKMLFGSGFALLRPEFSFNQQEIIKHRQQRIQSGLNSVLLMMGGTDPDDYSSKVLMALKDNASIEKITVVIGATAKHLQQLKLTVADLPQVELAVNANNVAQLMLEHDFSIGAAGTSSWERCACGLPSLVAIIADNQHLAASALIDNNAAKIMHLPASSNAIAESLNMMRDPDFYLKAVKSCLAICNGQGVEKVVEQLCSIQP